MRLLLLFVLLAVAVSALPPESEIIEVGPYDVIDDEMQVTLGGRQFTEQEEIDFQLDEIAKGQAFANESESEKRALPSAVLWTASVASNGYKWNPAGRKTVAAYSRHQKGCGSCWAFAALGVMDAYIVRQSRSLSGGEFELSRQQLLDCYDEAAFGATDLCDAGAAAYVWTHSAATGAKYYAHTERGRTPTEYPYRAAVGPKEKRAQCGYHGRGYAVAKEERGGFGSFTKRSFRTISIRATSIKRALQDRGPLVVRMVANMATMRFSTKDGANVSSLFDQCSSKPENDGSEGWHFMMLVGYYEYNGKEYWLARNSWGTGWGDRGYIRYKMGNERTCFNAIYYPVKVSGAVVPGAHDRKREVEILDSDFDPAPSSMSRALWTRKFVPNDPLRASMTLTREYIRMAVHGVHERGVSDAARTFTLSAAAVAAELDAMPASADDAANERANRQQLRRHAGAGGAHYWSFGVANGIEVEFAPVSAAEDGAASPAMRDVALNLTWVVHSRDALGAADSITFSTEDLYPYRRVYAADGSAGVETATVCVNTWQAGKDWRGWAHVTRVELTMQPVARTLPPAAQLRNDTLHFNLRRIAFAYDVACRPIAGYRNGTLDDDSLGDGALSRTTVIVIVAVVAAVVLLLLAAAAVYCFVQRSRNEVESRTGRRYGRSGSRMTLRGSYKRSGANVHRRHARSSHRMAASRAGTRRNTLS